jgi:nicotinate phosphoribosyltransferase
LNKIAAYLENGLTGSAVFELFVRKLPARRGFLMTAGLEQALQFLETVSFTPQELENIRRLGQFSESFLKYLRSFRFTGDVDTTLEGTVFFSDEPVLRVIASLPEGQFVETRLVNLLHFQTVVTSKAARMVLAVPGKPLIDYGLRRAHGGGKREYSPRAPAISLGSQARQRWRPASNLVSRFTGQWPIPLSRRMMTKPLPLSILRARARKVSCC